MLRTSCQVDNYQVFTYKISADQTRLSIPATILPQEKPLLKYALIAFRWPRLTKASFHTATAV